MKNADIVEVILKDAAAEWERQGRLPEDWWRDASALTSRQVADDYLRNILVGYLGNALLLGGLISADDPAPTNTGEIPAGEES